jgi:hypothetical protein
MTNRSPVVTNAEHSLDTCRIKKELHTPDGISITDSTKTAEQYFVPEASHVTDAGSVNDGSGDNNNPLQISHPVTTSLKEATEKLLSSNDEASSEEEMEALKRLEQAVKILARGAVRVAQKQKVAGEKITRKQSKTTDPKMSDSRTSAGIGIDCKQRSAANQLLNSPQITHSTTDVLPQVP